MASKVTATPEMEPMRAWWRAHALFVALNDAVDAVALAALPTAASATLQLAVRRIVAAAGEVAVAVLCGRSGWSRWTAAMQLSPAAANAVCNCCFCSRLTSRHAALSR